jgi:alkylhydroperoxidase family enzyme
VRAALSDFRTSPLSEREKALFELLEKANQSTCALRQEDVDRAKAAGWTDEALYDAITVCALFNFYNVWIDGTGVHDMPAAAYDASGHRLATEGYAR